MIKQAMLAAKLDDISQLRFPCLATPKLDGIRCFKADGTLYARSLKPIRNRHIIECLKDLPDGMDGELMAAGEDFHKGSGAIRRESGTPEFKWWVFDWYHDTRGYATRCFELEVWKVAHGHPCVQVVLPTQLDSLADFEEYFANAVNMGYEGVCTRTPDSPYVFRRSTAREQYLVKHKPWETSEMRIEDFQEQMENANDQVPNERGYMHRPGSRENYYPKDTLGALVGTDIYTGVQVRLGGGKGLTQALRLHIWRNQSEYVGKLAEYRFMKLGSREKPRMPQFVCFRDPEDLS